MPIARIVTRFPERAAALRKTLLDSGYRVEVLRPEQALQGEADIQYDIDDMPEYAGQPDIPAEREFIFAPQWRALMARFGNNDKPVDHAPLKPVEPAVSYARLEADLDERFVEQPSKGPSLTERVKALRAPLSEKLNSVRQGFDNKRQHLAQQMAERRAAAEESRRVREAELVKKREADRIAAERARAEAAVRMQKEREAQQAREAERLAEVQAQMAMRRKEGEQARLAAQQRAQAEAERQRVEAEQRARLEAERVRAAAIAHEAARQATPLSAPIERRHGLKQILATAFQDLGDWRGPYASTHFANTRVYAFRQYAPAAAGIALAFFLGWAIAVGGARKTAASNPTVKAEQTTSAAVPAAVVLPPVKTSKPSALPQKATATKPKAQVRRFRRPPKDDEVVWKDADDGGNDVTVIHHYPGKSNLARSGKKNGVKTISDLEQN
jgi:hypothetical protein